MIVTLERKQQLCNEEVFLDGKPAKIVGWKNDFAKVVDQQTGVGYEWAWSTVDRIVQNGGLFRS